MVDSQYRADADKIVGSANKIMTTIRENGFGTTTTMVVLTELMSLTQVSGNFMALPENERDDFFAEVWDAAIGNEPTAIIKQVGFFEGDTLETMTDGIKAGALGYFNRNLPAVA